jgi:hypothetical protein
MGKRLMNRLMKYLKFLLVILFIIFEEVIWNKIGKPAYTLVKNLKIMQRFKNWVSNVKHRYLVLGIFMIPFILMEVSSLFAISALTKGMIYTGIGLYTVKILLTAPVVIIFNSAKSQLVSFWIIKYSYGMILRFKRSATFRRVKQITKDVSEFKKEYMGSGELKAELKNLYVKIKQV